MATTNKKNKRLKSKEERAAEKAARKEETLRANAENKPVEITKPTGIMSRGQLIALIFLTMGISRLLQVGSAMRKEMELQASDGEQDEIMLNHLEAAPACVRFFNGTGANSTDGGDDSWTPNATCLEDGFNALLRYKFAMGWQVTAVVIAMVLQCWVVEEWLLRFTVGLSVTPILVSLLSLLMVAKTLVHESRVFQHFLLGVVLLGISIPPSFADWTPFVGGKLPAATPVRNSKKSLQSLVLVTMGALFLFQAIVKLGIPLLPKMFSLWSNKDNVMGVTESVLLWVNEELIATADTGSPSSLLVVLFLLVDKLTLAFAYFFAWFYFPEQQQRTLHLYSGVIFLVVAMYQWPWLEGQIANASDLKMIDWSIAGFSIIAWFAPSFDWKSRLSAATPGAVGSAKAKQS